MAGIVGYYLSSIGETTAVDTAKQHTVGKIGYGNAGDVYIYLQGNSNIAAGSVVSFTSAGAATILPISGVKSVPLAVAVSAVSATTKFGWFMLKGFTSVSVDSAIVAGDFLIVPGTTAGMLTRYAAGSPAFQSGAVVGVTPMAAASSNLASCAINYPTTTVVAAS